VVAFMTYKVEDVCASCKKKAWCEVINSKENLRNEEVIL